MVCFAECDAAAPLQTKLPAKTDPADVWTNAANVLVLPNQVPISQLLLCKLAARLHRFPLLGLQTLAALYRQTRSDIEVDKCAPARDLVQPVTALCKPDAVKRTCLPR